ncbi:AbfB domain-containing protein [Streptomyces sp. NPDC051954]
MSRRTSPATTYESYNYAGRCVRHREQLLYVRTPSTATDRADATFYGQ